MSQAINIDTILEFSKKYPYQSHADLARTILADKRFKFSSSLESLRKRINRIRLQNESKETEPKVSKERYKWKTIYGDIDFPIKMVDEIFLDYSKHGNDLSSTQIINKYNLDAWQWQSVKRKLLLFKDSHVFSPATVSKYKGEELEEKTKELIARKYENSGKLVEKAYEKETLKAYKKAISENDKHQYSKDIFYNEVMRLLPSAIISKEIPVKLKEVNGIATIVIADLHVGAEVIGIQNTPNFSPDILEDYLNVIALQVNENKFKEVNIAVLGDLIESINGMNHPNSWQGIAQGYYGSKVVIECVEILTRFIAKINNVKSVIGIGGNHDRITNSNKEDVKAEIATLIFYMLNTIYKGKIAIKYHHDLISEEIDGINFIITHGHTLEANKSEKMIIDYGNTKLFNIILAGHFHSRSTKKDDKKYRHLICPSLFSGNLYSKQLGLGSLPGYLIIENNGKGFPIITDISL